MEKACSRCTVQSLQVPQSRSEYLHSSHLVDSTRRAIRAGEDTEFRCLSHWEAELSRRCWNLLRLSRRRGWWRRMWRGGGSRRWESRQWVATKYDCWWSLFGQCQHLYCSLVSWIVGGGKMRFLTWIGILGRWSEEGIATPVRVIDLEMRRC